MNKLDLQGKWLLTSPVLSQPVDAYVPGDNYSALLAAGLIPDPYYADNEQPVQWVKDAPWSFARKLDITDELWQCGEIFLNIDSLDTFGTIYINDQLIGSSQNMFKRVRLTVKRFLHPGSNELRITLDTPEPYARKRAEEFDYKLCFPEWLSKFHNINHIRKVQCHGGWDWGICLISSGIYGNVYLQGTNGSRIEHVYTEQSHETDKCTVKVTAELYSLKAMSGQIEFKLNGETVTKTAALQPGLNLTTAEFEIKNPQLWYPRGYGEQVLYDLEVTFADMTVHKALGLRGIELCNEPDTIGREFVIKINDIPVFAKGADWIPCDALPGRQTPERYKQLITSALRANMNMLRVWGGGQYENELFYELCDRYGIMVWQDIMLACFSYPSSEAFIAEITGEVEYQIKRLRSHASIVLWCGDNEIGQAYEIDPGEQNRHLNDYNRISDALRNTIQLNDPERTFWPSSPCNVQEKPKKWRDVNQGDSHFWAVWHLNKPFDEYLKIKPRFCSEFGFQAFPTQATVDEFLPQEERNLFSQIMDIHQKNIGGNARIIGTFARYFCLPERFEDFIYLSQVQQAWAIKTAVEYWRSCKPTCMGTLYWQLNDNWPSVSWSSIDYHGRWKQLHYHAARFYAPIIVSAYKNSENMVNVHVTSDCAETFSGNLEVTLYDFTGKVLRRENLPVTVPAYQTLEVMQLPDSADPKKSFCYFELKGNAGNENFTHYNDYFYCEYKKCELQRANITAEISGNSLTLSTDVPAFFVFAETNDGNGVFSDNSFTLLPDRPRTLSLQNGPQVKKRTVTVQHLRGSYK